MKLLLTAQTQRKRVITQTVTEGTDRETGSLPGLRD